jgi:choline dehydrogenase-like flavoprotein
MDHVFFLSREGWKNARELNHYDLIVVGTGFCALAVASKALKNDPFCRILLIERGSFFLPEHFQNLPGPFVNTLGGLSETFPWTLAHSTQSGQDGTVRWQHGMVPFFGGRSTLWSSWCPRPTDEELDGWPPPTIAALKANFDEAEQLLHVQGADEIDSDRSGHECDLVVNIRPVYGKLQRRVETLLANNFRLAPGVYRT